MSPQEVMMHNKFLVGGGVAAGLVLFVWSAAYHMLIPWEKIALNEFKDTGAMVQAVKANAPANGMYFAPQGVFAAVAFLPDSSDKTALMGTNMAIEVVKDIVVGLLLAVILPWARTRTVVGRGALLGAIGLAAALSEHVSEWNWYGFSGPFTLLTMGDIVIGWFLAGLVLGALMNKMAVEPAGAAA
jgi:hypothetical protein